MISNGDVDTSPATVYTVSAGTTAVEINLIRVVNESAAARTFTVYLNVTGTARAISPIDTQLPIGAAYDDFPVFQLPPGATIVMAADAAGVTWTINAITL